MPEPHPAGNRCRRPSGHVLNTGPKTASAGGLTSARPGNQNPQRWYSRDPHSVPEPLIGAAATLKWDALAGLSGGAAGAGAGAGGLRLWSAEEPRHYLLVVELRGPDGAVLECEACQVGGSGAGPPLTLRLPSLFLPQLPALGFASASPQLCCGLLESVVLCGGVQVGRGESVCRGGRPAHAQRRSTSRPAPCTARIPNPSRPPPRPRTPQNPRHH